MARYGIEGLAVGVCGLEHERLLFSLEKFQVRIKYETVFNKEGMVFSC